MDLKDLRRRCELVLGGVEVPAPFDADVFAAVVASRRGRPLHLVPKTSDVGPCGIWLALPDADYVFFESGTSPVHRDHIVLHELGHVLSDHNASQVISHTVLQELLPSLDLSVVRRVLGRTSYTAEEEREAEVMASVIYERSLMAHRDADGTDELGIALNKMRETLGGARGLAND